MRTEPLAGWQASHRLGLFPPNELNVPDACFIERFRMSGDRGTRQPLGTAVKASGCYGATLSEGEAGPLSRAMPSLVPSGPITPHLLHLLMESLQADRGPPRTQVLATGL